MLRCVYPKMKRKEIFGCIIRFYNVQSQWKLPFGKNFFSCFFIACFSVNMQKGGRKSGELFTLSMANVWSAVLWQKLSGISQTRNLFPFLRYAWCEQVSFQIIFAQLITWTFLWNELQVQWFTIKQCWTSLKISSIFFLNMSYIPSYV